MIALCYLNVYYAVLENWNYRESSPLPFSINVGFSFFEELDKWAIEIVGKRGSDFLMVFGGA
jgi:hypothetical protein